MILNIRWVESTAGGGRSGLERKKFMAVELDEDEREAEAAWGPLFNGMRGKKDDSKTVDGEPVVVEESFERGGGPLASSLGDIMGAGMTWWQKPKGKKGPSILASDKEKFVPPQKSVPVSAPTIPASVPLRAPADSLAVLAAEVNTEHRQAGGITGARDQEVEIRRVTERMMENASVRAV